MGRITVNSAVVGAGILASLLIGAGDAWAGQLHGGWNYSIDSFRDGTQGRQVGENSAFEFYGLATKKMDNRVYFAVNSNLALGGKSYGSALNGSVAYGDLFLNFSNPDSAQAANGSMYAIRFDGSNDSGYNTQREQINDISVGLYSDVTGNGLMRQNLGHKNLLSYTRKVNNKYNGDVSYGDLEATTAYFNHDNGRSDSLNKTAYGYTNIFSGNRVGDVELVSNVDGLGLDFGHFGAMGDYTFSFSVDRDLLPDGDFIAHLFAECDNDGVALAGNTDVPEPSTGLGLAIIGLLGAGYRRLKSNEDLA